MVAGMELKLWRQGHLQWYDLPIEFHKHLQIVSKIDGGREETQTEW
jgi:hypothetical protein